MNKIPTRFTLDAKQVNINFLCSVIPNSTARICVAPSVLKTIVKNIPKKGGKYRICTKQTLEQLLKPYDDVQYIIDSDTSDSTNIQQFLKQRLCLDRSEVKRLKTIDLQITSSNFH